MLLRRSRTLSSSLLVTLSVTESCLEFDGHSGFELVNNNTESFLCGEISYDYEIFLHLLSYFIEAVTFYLLSFNILKYEKLIINFLSLIYEFSSHFDRFNALDNEAFINESFLCGEISYDYEIFLHLLSYFDDFQQFH